MTQEPTYIGSTQASYDKSEIKGELTTIEHELYYKISNSHLMRPFLISLVSDSNHWMFISSNGALSAGRKNSDYALFPYYTDDKITESVEITGSKTILRIHKQGKVHLWEPFSQRYEGVYAITRNLYKNAYGNKIIFEEHNKDLGLTYQYQWNSSNIYGFVRKSTLINTQEEAIDVEVLDGVQNIVPFGVGEATQNGTSNLVDAYKRSELIADSGVGIYALSAIIVDKAEPSEALKCNVVWSLGIENPTYLLSSLQLDNFRRGESLKQEEDIKAEKGAYFVHSNLSLAAGSESQWMLLANVNQNVSAIIELSEKIKSDSGLMQEVLDDIELGTTRLLELTGSSDGMQLSTDKLRNLRHFSNTLFNIMRGGIFDHNYRIEKWDFVNYIQKANKQVAKKLENILSGLPDTFSVDYLRDVAFKGEDKNFRRLSLEYMPLKFSRRHGDPSRPWNKFSINTRNEVDGSKILDYEGNWRDIFQNWEALSLSFPQFLESMIHKFLNATTFDGYNPYRVTKDGFDWEVIEEHDPWSYIGYWGDHQIIYLLKLLEILEAHQPGKLADYFNKDFFVYANVPYKIKSYDKLLENPKDTIEFDYGLDGKIRALRSEIGADGALLRNENATIHQVNFIEKILATVLAKVSNFIPEGGIWMNTQRPEWNDANNALVGNGVSMVTLYYLRRFFRFFGKIVAATSTEQVKISEELLECFQGISSTLTANENLLSGAINDTERKSILDGLGTAASNFRMKVYDQAFSGNKKTIELKSISDFIAVTLRYLDHTIDANKRNDAMYHAYNLMTLKGDGVSISYLEVMLEGQVAALSSGYLAPEACLALLDSMKQSALFREDQYSYLLYPNKELPKFLEKNIIPEKAVEKSKLLQQLLEDGNVQIIEKDIKGNYHFNGNFNNANRLDEALDVLEESNYGKLVSEERQLLLDTFEEVFNHKAFTGRSGTFFGYEGLGSIYWHMVSKLQLAVQECCLMAIDKGANDSVIGRLLEHYYEINEGIGVHKPPKLYGAFPTDPYSHTPAGKGAQQPGMTGQVKEDILSRFGELGVFVEDGKLVFNPCLLRQTEFLSEQETFHYVDVSYKKREIEVPKNALCFTYCQVPVIYEIAESEGIEAQFKDGNSKNFKTLRLDEETSLKLFMRTAEVDHITVQIPKSYLK